MVWELVLAELIAEFWQGIVVIFVACAAAAFISSRLGVIVAALMTLGSILLAIVLLAVPTGGGGQVLMLGFVLFPSIAWTGYVLGRLTRRKFF